MNDTDYNNYTMLNNYLKKNRIISKMQFRAVMETMKMLSSTEYNRRYVYKVITGRFPVSANFLQKILLAIDFKSNAQKHNRNIRQAHIGEKIADQEFKTRMQLENQICVFDELTD